MPGDGTMVIVDWIVLACQEAGLSAEAMPVGDSQRAPHGMYVEVAPAGPLEERISALPCEGVDLLVAGEHMELMRAIMAGYADPCATTIVSSCHRSFTAAERAVLPHHVLSEREIDRVAADAAERYIAFDGPEVAAWYRLAPSVQPALLFGAVCGAGTAGLTVEQCEAAIARLGIDVRVNLHAFRLGMRMGRRPGGRVRRTLTAAQFVRKRRGRLPRRDRALFEQIVDRIEQQFGAEHRAVLREAVFMLADYESAEYAQLFVEQCEAVAREEARIRPEPSHAGADGRIPAHESVVPLVARALAGIMAYIDGPHAAHVRTGRRRLAELRQRHGIARGDVYRVRDLIPVEAAAPGLARRLLRRRATAPATVTTRPHVVTVNGASLLGALRLQRLARGRRHRASSERMQRELALARHYVATVIESLQVGHDIARIVAASGALVGGFGASRASASASAQVFWGRVVRHAFAVDAAHPAGDASFSRMVIPFVYDQLCTSGPLALWECSGQVVGIALACARGGTHEQAMELARHLCQPRSVSTLPPPQPAPSVAEAPAAPPAIAAATDEPTEDGEDDGVADAATTPVGDRQ